MTWQEKTFNWL